MPSLPRVLTRFGPRSVKDRLTVVTVVGTTAILVVALGVLYVALSAQLRVAIDNGLAVRADDLVAGLREGGMKVPSEDPLAQVYTPSGALLDSSISLFEPMLTPAQVTAAAHRQTHLDVTDPRGREEDGLRVLVRPVEIGGRHVVVAVAASQSPAEDARRRVLLVMALTTPVLVAVLALAGRLVLSAALRPVDVLAEEAEEIAAAGRPRQLPPFEGHDEIAHMARTLAGMLHRLEVSFDRERAFVDDASHELRTPLAVLRGELELGLVATDDPEEVRRSLKAALRECERLSSLAEDLLVLAREDGGGGLSDPQTVDVRSVADEVAARLSRDGLAVSSDGPSVSAWVDRLAIERALSNLVGNSAAAGAHRVRIRVSRRSGRLRLRVEDDGPGFPPALLPSAFERFTRGDAARTRREGGAGLGLAIVAAIVRAHEGTVTADNTSSLGGAGVTLNLPVRRGPG
ncbi:MAG TPA: HAMP domain-containing sensor histidine kinase [Candidatus Eisenbacteria bacterium]|nr:HAMP domain-containing sensor histidine kinase [Candidatus Eisenbacteria bacterium]